MPEIVVTEGDKGRSFQARIGDSIVVRLPETPTTGFRWNAMLSDARVIEAQSDDYVPDGSAPGSGGLRTFRYLAKAEGVATLNFHLARPWEREPPRLEFGLRVTVQ